MLARGFKDVTPGSADRADGKVTRSRLKQREIIA